MTTCAEWQAQLTVAQAAVVVDDAALYVDSLQTQLDQAQKTRDTMLVWWIQYSMAQQGCSPGMMATAPEPESVAETRGRERVWEALKAKLDQDVEDVRTRLAEGEKALDDARAVHAALMAA